MKKSLFLFLTLLSLSCFAENCYEDTLDQHPIINCIQDLEQTSMKGNSNKLCFKNSTRDFVNCVVALEETSQRGNSGQICLEILEQANGLD